ncbi:MAG: hypothetical protein LC114_24980 [Bryobacterales bacterium]|nr:hypothetical protein [Bryobacterales bacterium]
MRLRRVEDGYGHNLLGVRFEYYRLNHDNVRATTDAIVVLLIRRGAGHTKALALAGRQHVARKHLHARE